MLKEFLNFPRPWMKPHVAADERNHVPFFCQLRQFRQAAAHVREWFFHENVEPVADYLERMLQV